MTDEGTQCETCGKEFGHSANHKTHIKTVHERRKELYDLKTLIKIVHQKEHKFGTYCK